MHRVLLPLLALSVATPAFAGFEASSFKSESKLGKNFWNAGAALDMRSETCWQVDPERENVGQWIQLDTPMGEIDKIEAIIGWDKDENAFFDHARLKKVKVEVFAKTIGGELEPKGETEATFDDKRGWQVIDVSDIKVNGEYMGATVRLTVQEVYGGKDFPNLAVSEVRVRLKEFPADTLDFGAVPSSEDPEHTGADLIDSNPKTFWAATGKEATFGLKAPGYGLSSVGLHAGPKSHARPKKVKITNQNQEITHELEDKPGEMQWLLLPTLTGYTGGGWGEVTVEILESYPGDDPMNGVALAEATMMAGSIEEF
jgi:hypothetical protein